MKNFIRVIACAWLSLLSGLAGAQTVEYIHTDALGSMAAVADGRCNVVERHSYGPCGAQLSSS